MDRTIYKKFADIEAKLKNSKHAKLQDVHAHDIVSFNQPKKPIKPKVEEIKRKLQSLPDGLYVVVAMDRFGKNVHQDKYYFGKGKYESSMSEPGEQFTPPKHSSNGSGENLLSLDSAVNNIREASELKAENKFLKEENERLKKKVDELEKEVEALNDANEALSQEEEEGEEENPFGALGGFFKEISPMVPGLADRWFTLQEKREETKRAELMFKHGYTPPKNGKKVNGSNKARMPEPGSAEWEEYIEEVKALPDEQFEAHLQLIESKFPNLYPILCEEVYEGSEEEEAEGGEE